MGWEGVMGMPWGEACVVIVRGEGRREKGRVDG